MHLIFLTPLLVEKDCFRGNNRLGHLSAGQKGERKTKGSDEIIYRSISFFKRASVLLCIAKTYRGERRREGRRREPPPFGDRIHYATRVTNRLRVLFRRFPCGGFPPPPFLWNSSRSFLRSSSMVNVGNLLRRTSIRFSRRVVTFNSPQDPKCVFVRSAAPGVSQDTSFRCSLVVFKELSNGGMLPLVSSL